MQRIGNGNLLHRSIEQNTHALVFHIERGLRRNPQHKPPHCVLIQGGAIGFASGNKLARIIHVRRKKQIEWSAIVNLLRERPRCSERKLYFHAGLLLVGIADLFQRGAQIGRRSHGDLSAFLLLRPTPRRTQNNARRQLGAGKRSHVRGNPFHLYIHSSEAMTESRLYRSARAVARTWRRQIFPKWSADGSRRRFCVASPASALDTGRRGARAARAVARTWRRQIFPKWSADGSRRRFCVASPASALDTGR